MLKSTLKRGLCEIRSHKIGSLHGNYPSFVLMNMRFAAPRDKSVFETLPLEALEFSLQNKLKKVR